MSTLTSPQLELLRAKLALAIRPLEINPAYDEVRAARPNALDEPWSDDMSGPHRHVVFNNKTFVLSEVADEQLASSIVRGCPPINAGENIKLYLNDVWQHKIFQMMGLDMAAIRDPVTGRDPMGSLYYSLVTSVDECILKKKLSENRAEEDGDLGMGDLVMDEKWEELMEKEWAEEGNVNEDGQEKQHGAEEKQGEKDSVKRISVGEENPGHADAVMDG